MKKLELKLFFSGEDADLFREMMSANRKRPVDLKERYCQETKRTIFTITCQDEREIFNLGFLWKDKIQPYAEKAPF